MIQKIQTDIIKVDSHHPEKAEIERAAALLRAGEVVVFPTETVYGLGADTLQPEAVEKIFAAKERPYSDPLIAHIADLSMLEQIVTDIPALAHKLAQAFWPGPLTLILPASERVPRLVTAGLPTVGVRMPGHPVALALIRAAGSPVAAPSANRFMHVSPTTAQHVSADLDGRVPLILDGGPCTVGVESTILDLCAPVPTILRPGGVSLEALRSIIPEVQPPVKRTARKNSDEEVQKAPGQMTIHYAPRVPAILFEGPLEAMRNAMLHEIQRRKAQGEHVGVLIIDDDMDTFRESGAYIYTLGTQPEQVATRLYAGLRVLEESGVQVILCRSIAEHGIGLAIRDRLLKATGGKIIHSTLL
jgi:L-threonylcarbamoyladenylate synthase